MDINHIGVFFFVFEFNLLSSYLLYLKIILR